MKQLLKTSGVIALLVMSSSVSFAQWETIRFIDDTYPLPWINSISFTDVNNGLGACSGMVSYHIGGPSSDTGAIIKTTDGGLTWNNMLTVDSTSFLKVVHSSPDTAYCVGSKWEATGIIARTTDAGLTWDTTITANPLFSVSFTNNNTGYVCGANGTILKTTNAGNSWQPVNSGVTGYLDHCLFLNDSVGFVTGDPIILKTTNGGLNWNTQNFATGIVAISFPSFNIGYIVVAYDYQTYHIYKTTDNGNQWTHISTINTHMYISSIYFPNELTGYISGQFQMYKTIDGGLNWITQSASPPGWEDFMDDLMDVFCLNADTCFAAGNSQFYRTFRGGDSTSVGTGDISIVNQEVQVYPNPARESATFKLGRHKEAYSLFIYNVNGQIVKRLENITGEQFVLDMQNFQQGVFFYRLTGKAEIIARGKIIVE